MPKKTRPISSQFKNQVLIVVAHPDDESIFFAGLILSLRTKNIHVVCVTDGNADAQKQTRLHQFRKATRQLGVKKITVLNLPDVYSQRLNTDVLEECLKKWLLTPATLKSTAAISKSRTKRVIPSPKRSLSQFSAVYTHGPLGEYGHPHHQDVSYAVHKLFHGKCPVYSVAYNCEPDITVNLNPRQFKLKSKILSKIYFSETERFINFLPATFTEGFCRLELKEVESIYKFLCHLDRPVQHELPSKSDSAGRPKPLQKLYLKKYKWFAPYLNAFRDRIKSRPF